MRRMIKIYRNQSYEWPEGTPVPARSVDMQEIDRWSAHLVSTIRNESLARVFQRFSEEGRHGVFAMVDGVPAGHAWITAPASSPDVVNSYARLASGECLIHYCYVDPAHRGRGIYGEMLHELTAWAIASGARRVFVDTGNDNVASQHGIRRAGFAEHEKTLDIVVARRLLWSRRWPIPQR